jgi:hypothetical protein
LRHINTLVICGYGLLGGMLLAGYVLDKGALVALAAYGGWFLTAYSVVAYAFVAWRYLGNERENFWTTLYPVNFSLALVAIALFGLHSMRSLPPLAASVMLGAVLGFLASKSTLTPLRAAPLVALIPLGLCLVPSISPYWTLLFVLVAAFLMTRYANVRLMHRCDNTA